MEETIRALQNKVNTALLQSDWQTLNELVAPEAKIIGPKGFMISRDEWIGVHQSTDYQQVRLQPTETDLRIAGRFRVMHVWVTDHEKWQLAGVQYTGLPRTP